jgi:hypothetical protein
MTREEQLAQGKLWTYGYHTNPKWMEHIKAELPLHPNGELCIQQYDLEMFFFLNYADWPTDVAREEHWWRAAALRWPEKDADGLPGPFKRHPWAERVIWAASNYQIVNLMGGAGQGKTTAPIAFGITIFDYFNHTFAGARFTVSSVNERKLRNAAWPAIDDLYKRSNKACSASVSRGKVFDLAVKRPEVKSDKYSTKGLIQAILISNSNKTAVQVDAITGSHVPTAQILLIDEAQSAPNALDKAAYNLRTHPKYFWMFRAGNPDQPDDYLGKACEPIGGYDRVDPIKNEDPDQEWETNYDGQLGYVLRFDNDYSPGVLEPELYPFMPKVKNRDEQFKTPESRRTAGYFRFWKAWFVPAFADDSVIKWNVIEQTGCDKFPSEPNYRSEVINFASFDSAPASLDRSVLTHGQLIYDGRKRVIHFQHVYLLPKTTSADYWSEAVQQTLIKCREWQVPSGNLICDDTAQTGFPTMLMEKGFLCRRMIYHQSPTDKVIDPMIRKRAKEHCGNLITEAALLLEAFIRYGQVRGLNDSLCQNFREEVCSRRMISTQGGKMQLESKASKTTATGTIKGFRDRMGFSPDIFDTLCQAAFFVREYLAFHPMSVDLAPVDTLSNKPKPKGLFSTRKFLAHA